MGGEEGGHEGGLSRVLQNNSSSASLRLTVVALVCEKNLYIAKVLKIRKYEKEGNKDLF